MGTSGVDRPRTIPTGLLWENPMLDEIYLLAGASGQPTAE